MHREGATSTHRSPTARLLNGLVCTALLAMAAWQLATTDSSRIPATLVGLMAAAGLWVTLFAGGARNRLLATIVLVSLPAGEIGLRTWVPRADFENLIYRFPRPYLGFTARPGTHTIADPMSVPQGRDATLRINSLGLRHDHEITVPKPPNEFRIVVLGGSTVFNGSTPEQTIPGALEAALTSHPTEPPGGASRDYRVYNCGVVSFVSGQELSLLLHHVIDLQPDLVISYNGCNDLASPLYYDPRPGYPYNEIQREQRVAAGILHHLGGLLGQSRLLRTLFPDAVRSAATDQAAMRATAGFATEEWENRIIERFASNLTKMARLSRAHGARFMAALQPMLQHKRPATDSEQHLRYGERHDDYFARQYPRAQAMYRELDLEFTSDPEVAFVDVTNAFDGYEKPAFWDYVHTSNEGNAHLAGRLLEELQRLQLLR